MTSSHFIYTPVFMAFCRDPSSPDHLQRVVILLVVDTHDKHGSVGAGRRDHHPLGSTLQVSLQGQT